MSASLVGVLFRRERPPPLPLPPALPLPPPPELCRRDLGGLSKPPRLPPALPVGREMPAGGGGEGAAQRVRERLPCQQQQAGRQVGSCYTNIASCGDSCAGAARLSEQQAV